MTRAFQKEPVPAVLPFTMCLELHFLKRDSWVLQYQRTSSGNAWRLRQLKFRAGNEVHKELLESALGLGKLLWSLRVISEAMWRIHTQDLFWSFLRVGGDFSWFQQVLHETLGLPVLLIHPPATDILICVSGLADTGKCHVVFIMKWIGMLLQNKCRNS